MTEQAAQTEATDLYTFTWDEETGILRLIWTEATAHMSDQDFQHAVRRYAERANHQQAGRLLVDVRQFKHRVGAGLDAWRKEEIVPLYNRAGVQKFAYLFPPDASLPEGGQPKEGEAFVTHYFNDEAAAQAWLAG